VYEINRRIFFLADVKKKKTFSVNFIPTLLMHDDLAMQAKVWPCMVWFSASRVNLR
jgi:hypothetical protein